MVVKEKSLDRVIVDTNVMPKAIAILPIKPYLKQPDSIWLPLPKSMTWFCDRTTTNKRLG